jgi:hypothetical protein
MTADSDNKTKFMQISVDVFKVGGLPITPQQKQYYRTSDIGVMHGAIFALNEILNKNETGVIPVTYDGTDIHLTSAGYIWLGGDNHRHVTINAVHEYLKAQPEGDIDLGLFGTLSAERKEFLLRALSIRDQFSHLSQPVNNQILITEASPS